MGSDTAVVAPELKDLDVCRSCGAPIAWVEVRPGGRRRPVDVESKRLAEYVLLRDGRTVINDRQVPDDLDGYDGPRFWDHAKTCTTPSMRTVRDALKNGYAAVRRTSRQERTAALTPAEQYREEERARLLKAGRAPWVTRRNEPPAR